MKKMRLLFGLLFFIFYYGSSYGQCSEGKFVEGNVWVVLNKNIHSFNPDNIIISNPDIDSVLSKYRANRPKRSFPYSKRDYLKRVYSIKFDGKTNDFVNELSEANDGIFF